MHETCLIIIHDGIEPGTFGLADECSTTEVTLLQRDVSVCLYLCLCICVQYVPKSRKVLIISYESEQFQHALLLLWETYSVLLSHSMVPGVGFAMQAITLRQRSIVLRSLQLLLNPRQGPLSLFFVCTLRYTSLGVSYVVNLLLTICHLV